MADGNEHQLDPRSAIDLPRYVAGAGGSPTIIRPRRPTDTELPWTRALMARYETWRSVVDLPTSTSIVLEYPCRYPHISETPPKSAGLPRIDALVWHGPKRCSLVEAKVKTDPSSVMGGVGQLLYYKAWIERVEGCEVEALVLAAPSLPPLARSHPGCAREH